MNRLDWSTEEEIHAADLFSKSDAWGDGEYVLRCSVRGRNDSSFQYCVLGSRVVHPNHNHITFILYFLIIKKLTEEKSKRVISEISDFPLRNKNTCFNHIEPAEKGQGF